MTPTHSADSRRRFVQLLGGGAVFAATAPLAACSAALPTSATGPWAAAGGETDLRRFILAHALLAPNPHNRQPWIADLSVPDHITLVCDGERLLPETDPFGRQILVGCGAFVELAVIAAAQRGVAVEVTAFPAGAPAAQALPAGTVVATLRLGAPGSASADPLFTQITRRHTHKGAYATDRALPPGLAAQWAGIATRFGLTAGVIDDPAAMAPLRRLTREAYEIEALTPRTWLESARLMRIGPAAIAEHRDGISINGTMPRMLHALGLFDPMEVPTRASSGFKQVMDRWANFETCSAYLWLAASAPGRAPQLAAGRAWARLQLQATAVGISLHPLSQALQEFAEMRGPYQALHRALGRDAAQAPVQMFARAGFGLEPAAPSPRRELGSLLKA
jgi:hypothetical protein